MSFNVRAATDARGGSPFVPRTPPGAAIRSIAAGAVLAVGLPGVSSCDATTGPGDGHDADVCAAGTVHAGSPVCTEWEAGPDPHVLADTVRLTQVTIGPGATVCGTPGAVLIAPEIHAAGTVEQPIVFTACDTATGWGGLRQPYQDAPPEHDGGTIRNARIELAEIGVVGLGLKLDSVVVRDTRGPAVASLGSMRVTNSAVETSCTNECAGSVEVGAVFVRLHAAVQSVSGSLSLVHVAVRGARGDGVARSGNYSWLILEDVLIEDNAGVGLWEPQSVLNARNGGLKVTGRLRIRGNRSPAAISSWSLDQVLPTPEASDNLLGNHSDTVEVGLMTSVTPGTITAGLPWRVVNNSQSLLGFSIPVDGITFEPGATLVGVDAPPLARSRDLEGTAAQPITMTDIHLQAIPTGPDTLRVRHVRLEGGSTLSSCGDTSSSICLAGGEPVLFEDVNVDHGSVIIQSPGALLRRISVRNTPSSSLACTTTWQYCGSGIEVAADKVEIDGCDITGAAEDGIGVGRWGAVAGVRIHGCNLYENGGLGVNNLAPDSTTADASGNWWGSADGPNGASGDGVSAGVVFMPWLTAPLTH